MTFFSNYPLVDYVFGDEITPALFQNITTYVDLVDQVADDASIYETYFIEDGIRPDVLSYQLYGTIDYYWTFYLLNDKLRQQGWPLDEQEVTSLAKEFYPNKTFLTTYKLYNEFYVNNIIIAGSINNPTFKGKIIEKNLDLGQITVKPFKEVKTITITNGGSGYTVAPKVTITGGGGEGARATAFVTNGAVTQIEIDDGGDDYTTTPTVTIALPDSATATSGDRATATATVSSYTFNGGEVQSRNGVYPDTWTSDNVKRVDVHRVVDQLNAVHHYSNSDGTYYDLPIDYNSDTLYLDNRPDFPALRDKTPTTYLNRLKEQNDELRQIKVFTQAMANKINTEFQKALRS